MSQRRSARSAHPAMSRPGALITMRRDMEALEGEQVVRYEIPGSIKSPEIDAALVRSMRRIP